MLPYFPYIFILEKNNLNKTQILQIENNFQKDFKLDPFKLPTHISYVLKKSFYLLSWKSLSCLKFMNWEYFQMKFKYFQIPFHLIKWKKSYHLRSRVLYLKRIWIHGDQNAKMKVWESPFIPSHLTFKRFRISLNFTQSSRLRHSLVVGRGWCLPTHPGSRHGTCNLGLLHQLYCRGFPYSLSVKKN